MPAKLRRYLKYVYHQDWRINKVVSHNEEIIQDEPLLSVVIPYYNRADTIDETIECLKNQSFKNFEVILVDDGSNDPKSVDKLSQLGVGSLKIKILAQKNQGVAAARNTGIKASKGKYVMCLDSDDTLDVMYIEKCLITLESNHNIDLVFTDMRMFGINNTFYRQADYNASELLHNNIVTTAAMFRKECWEAVGGFKSDIGYEDWEFWINLAEHGYFGHRIQEPLFNYRTAIASRYIDDKAKHKINLRAIRSLHPGYSRHIRKLRRAKYYIQKIVPPEEQFVNLSNSADFLPVTNNKYDILIVAPWMTFGGAETLIYNYCRELKDDFNITFVTTKHSEHEWEYKFKEISARIYHMPNLLKDRQSTVEFMSNYIRTNNVELVHLIHTDSILDLLPELKSRYPHLKALLTLFNDRVPQYMEGAVKYQAQIDGYVTDNQKVATSLTGILPQEANISVIPNGIDSYNEFSRKLFDVTAQRTKLGVLPDDIAVFFVGRLSEEKNPDVFIEAAKTFSNNPSVKFFIIGDGPMRDFIENEIEANKYKNIYYLGYQSDIAHYLSAADIFILPSSIEGFPLSILEAMAMEVAVIASDVGAVSEVIDTGVDGYVVKPGNAEEIADRINQLVKDKSKLDTIKDRSRKKVEEKYSNIILGDNYKKLYRKVMK